MFTAPPRTTARTAWTWAMAWMLVVWATIPLARAVQHWIEALWSRELFLVVTITALAAGGAAGATAIIRRHKRRAIGRLSWLIAIGSVYAYFIREVIVAPEEAFHFLQYGVLGLLVLRAFAVRHHDAGSYIAAALVCALAGSIDEVIQWATPDRHFDLGDIGLNVLGGGLVQLAVAAGLRPPYLHRRPGHATRIRALALAGTVGLLFAAVMANTPARTEWLIRHVAGMQFLQHGTNHMVEYGHRYDDPRIGTFFSRFAPAQLAAEDRRRAVTAAATLDTEGTPYKDFLAQYRPGVDPFLHELRVHLFRRDRLRARAAESADAATARRYRTIALREHRIVTHYFPQTMQHTQRYALPASIVTQLEAEALPSFNYVSPVSRNIITRFSARIASLTCLSAGLTLLAIAWMIRYRRTKHDREGSNASSQS